MEARKSTAKYWAIFFVWLVIMIAILAMPDYRQWFWLALPGVCTYFALAMDIM